jgi:hypothetical protein
MSNAEVDTRSRCFPVNRTPLLTNMKMIAISVFACWTFAGGRPSAMGAEERVAAIPEGAFPGLMEVVKPQPKESPWREIEWVTNVTEARRRAVAEGKPLVIFTAADGSPLGRT